MEFLVAPPVNMGEEGEFIDALGVMDAEGMEHMEDIEPEDIELDGIDMEGMDDMEPEGMAMAMEDIELEGIDMDMDMLLIPIPIPIPVLPSFLVLAPTYETYPVNIHIKTFFGEGVELHTSIIAGPAMMLSSVA